MESTLTEIVKAMRDLDAWWSSRNRGYHSIGDLEQEYKGRRAFYLDIYNKTLEASTARENLGFEVEKENKLPPEWVLQGQEDNQGR